VWSIWLGWIAAASGLRPAPFLLGLAVAGLGLGATLIGALAGGVAMAKLGMVPVDTPSVAELQAYVKSEIVRWGKVVEKSGAAMD